MREWKIICDKCGVEITGNPFAVTLERVGREEDAPIIGETYELDLCENCVDELQSWKAVHASVGIVPEQSMPDPEEKENHEELPERQKDAPEEKQTEELPLLKLRKHPESDQEENQKQKQLISARW